MSLLGAARTVLAAGGGCSPGTGPHRVRIGGPELPCLPTWSGLVIGPGRWRARNGPLSVAGSCRPSPDRQSEATSADRGRRSVLTVTGSEVCCCKGFASAGYPTGWCRPGRPRSPRCRDGPPSRSSGYGIARWGSGHGAAEPFSASPAPHGVAPRCAGVGEVEVLHDYRGTLMLPGGVEQCGDRRADPPITPRCRHTGGIDADGDRGPDRVARPSSTQAARWSALRSTPSTGPVRNSSIGAFGHGVLFPGRVQIPTVLAGVVGDVVTHRAPAATRQPTRCRGGKIRPAQRHDCDPNSPTNAPGTLIRNRPASSTRMVSLPPALPDSPSAVRNIRAAFQRPATEVRSFPPGSRWERLRHNRFPPTVTEGRPASNASGGGEPPRRIASRRALANRSCGVR